PTIDESTPAKTEPKPKKKDVTDTGSSPRTDSRAPRSPWGLIQPGGSDSKDQKHSSQGGKKKPSPPLPGDDTALTETTSADQRSAAGTEKTSSDAKLSSTPTPPGPPTPSAPSGNGMPFIEPVDKKPADPPSPPSPGPFTPPSTAPSPTP